MNKETLCVLLLALSAAHFDHAIGARQMITDVLRITNKSIESIFMAASYDFNKTQYAITQTFETMMSSEMNQTTTDIQDPKLKSALEGLQARFVALCMEIQNPIEEALARIGSMQVTANACQVSLQRVVGDLLLKGQCSTRKINLALSQIHNCLNEGIDNVVANLRAIKMFLSDSKAEFTGILKEHRSCFLKVEAPHCLNEIKANSLPVFFSNIEKSLNVKIEVRPTMELLSRCSNEIATDVPKMCQL